MHAIDTILVADDDGELIGYYKTLGFRTVGATRVTIGSEEVGDDLVMVLVR